MDFAKAIKQFAPGAKSTVCDNCYEGIEWLDLHIPKPTEQELVSAFEIVQAAEALVSHKPLRAADYPAIEDQLDMLWHAMDQHLIPCAKSFYDAIKAVKEQYPKAN